MEIERIIAYQEGYTASIEADSNPRSTTNPYPKDTPEWRSWNQGWNTHFEPSWLKQITGSIPEEIEETHGEVD